MTTIYKNPYVQGFFENIKDLYFIVIRRHMKMWECLKALKGADKRVYDNFTGKTIKFNAPEKILQKARKKMPV